MTLKMSVKQDNFGESWCHFDNIWKKMYTCQNENLWKSICQLDQSGKDWINVEYINFLK